MTNPRSKRSTKPDELTWTDLLDGTSMPTIPDAQESSLKATSSMSTQTDSIISLPPLDNRAARWNNLQSAAPPRIPRVRGGSLSGRDIPRMMDKKRRPRHPATNSVVAPTAPANAPQVGAEEVHIGFSPLSVESSVGPALNVRHKRRSSRFKSDDFTEDAVDRASNHDMATKTINYGSMSSGRLCANANPLSGGYPSRDDDEGSTGNSSVNDSSTRRHRRRWSRSFSRRLLFEEHQWDWRFPGNEDALMPVMAWFYLPLIGWLVFAIAFSVNHGEVLLRGYIIDPLYRITVQLWGHRVGLVVLCIVRSVVALVSFVIVYNFSPLYGPGSGIPEMKCVLTGVFMPNALSGTTLASKMVGLSLISASGISVGKMGPFIHMGAMVASLVSQIPIFKALKENPLFKLQALSAATAAGVGATFGAPLGGVMLSIELMSSYYYVHWLPIAMFCSIMGYYLLKLFVETDAHEYFDPDIVLTLVGHAPWFVFVYSVLGIICGFVGFCLIKCTLFMKKSLSLIFTIDQPQRMALFLASFVVLHTVVARSVGGVLDFPQKAGVDKLFGTPKSDSYEWLNASLRLWDNSFGNASALFLIMWIKFALTSVSLVLPIPAGTFMPIFEIGAFLGRCYGELLRGLPPFQWIDPRATAIVGAASLATGTLHVASIALVMLELTREAVNVLPITVSVVFSYALSRSLSFDLFSELIKLRGLPYILGLREQHSKEKELFQKQVSSIVARSFMERRVAQYAAVHSAQMAKESRYCWPILLRNLDDVQVSELVTSSIRIIAKARTSQYNSREKTVIQQARLEAGLPVMDEEEREAHVTKI